MIKSSDLTNRFLLIYGVVLGALILGGISRARGQNGLRGNLSQPSGLGNSNLSARTVELAEKISVSVPRKSKIIQIWMPIPINDSNQSTEILSVDSPYPYRITKDKEFGNRLLYFQPELAPRNQNIEISVRYKIERKEQRFQNGNSGIAASSNFIKARGLEIINEKIESISKETTRGIRDPFLKAKAIYDYVLRHMSYDKSGTGWGQGDSSYACDIGKGNCTDFHSLFIAMARASQIPARFQMGIPLPESSEGEPSGSYHCWAEFYIDGKGWIPVDISEAWKHPEKADYFFGNLDVNRILLSTGREILLSPQQKGSPLNYLSKPYIEIEGRPVTDFKLDRRFKDKKT